jgi:hypothetical protein
MKMMEGEHKCGPNEFVEAGLPRWFGTKRYWSIFVFVNKDVVLDADVPFKVRPVPLRAR